MNRWDTWLGSAGLGNGGAVGDGSGACSVLGCRGHPLSPFGFWLLASCLMIPWSSLVVVGA